jgi:hypothetical protein
MQQTQHKPVRFYITQDDDQPIVRTIPVATHPVPRVTATADQVPVAALTRRAPRKVAKLMRLAKRRPSVSQ